MMGFLIPSILLIAVLQTRRHCCAVVNVTNIRLVDAATGTVAHTAGVVELQINGNTSYWGLVCSNGFDDKDARVACRMLGFKYGSVESLGGNLLPERERVFVLGDINCVGNETSLAGCEGTQQPDCHSDAGKVRCSAENPYHADLKLHSKEEVDGIGFVMIANPKKPGEWGYVCSAGFFDVAATLVCRQLGYDTRGFTPQPAVPKSFENLITSPRIVTGRVSCLGFEDALAQCVSILSFNNISVCPGEGVAGVQCVASKSTITSVKIDSEDVNKISKSNKSGIATKEKDLIAPIELTVIGVSLVFILLIPLALMVYRRKKEDTEPYVIETLSPRESPPIVAEKIEEAPPDFLDKDSAVDPPGFNDENNDFSED